MKKGTIVLVILFSLLLTLGVIVITGCFMFSFCQEAFDCFIEVSQDGSSYDALINCKSDTCEVERVRQNSTIFRGVTQYCTCK